MSLTSGFLNGSYTAAQFAEAHFRAFGNGVCAAGGKLEVTARGSNGVSVGTGYALAGGYWFKSDTTTPLYIEYGEIAGGRYDAVVLRVDLQNKAADIALVKGVAASKPVKYTPVRDEEYYELVLAYVYVAPATTLISESNITDTRADTDLCGMIALSAELSREILKVYSFALSGFDSELSALRVSLEELLASVGSLQPAWDKTGELDADISSINQAGYRVGNVLTARARPSPAVNWLLCDGGNVPATYPTLSALLGGTLPDITPADARLSAWIYGGTPQ